jgi:excinuclease UvrABC nuclease subunit
VNDFEPNSRDWRLHQPGRWEQYDLMQDRLPRFAGVYAVFFDGDLVYVGSSTDIANRFSEHKVRFGYAKNIVTPWAVVPDSTRVTLKVRRSRIRGDWAMWEIRLIFRLQPQFNRQHRGRRAA